MKGDKRRLKCGGSQLKYCSVQSVEKSRDQGCLNNSEKTSVCGLCAAGLGPGIREEVSLVAYSSQCSVQPPQPRCGP